MNRFRVFLSDCVVCVGDCIQDAQSYNAGCALCGVIVRVPFELMFHLERVAQIE